MPRLRVVPLLACLVAAPAAAQELTPAQSRLGSDRQSPTLDAQAGFAGSGYALTADSDASTASIAFARHWDGADGIDYSTTSIRLSAPLNKDTRTASFVTDDGFIGATSIQVSVSTVWGDAFALPATWSERQAAIHRVRGACLARALTDDETKKCREASWETLPSLLSAADRTAFRDDFARLQDAGFATSPIWTSGFTASVGHNEFKFRDPLSFVESGTNRTPYAVSAYVGFSPDSRPLYVAGGLEYKVDYKAATSRTLCPPVPIGSVAECFTGAFAAPVEDVNATVFVVSRSQFSIGGGRFSVPGGLEVKAAYDFEDEVAGLSSALYVVPDAAGALRGGVKLSWSDEDDEVRIGVFVASAFSLF